LRRIGPLLALVAILILGLSIRSGSTGLMGGTARLTAEGETEARPNILFITIDALSAKHIGSYGNSGIQTPTIDSLAGAGVKFLMQINSFSQTNPSIASIFTASYPAATRVRVHGADRLPDSIPTLASVLADHGYNTAAIYSSRAMDPETSGLDRGFKLYQPVYYPNPDQEDIWRLFDGRADLTTDGAVAWLDHEPATPFFLWVHYQDPHYPYMPPPPFDTMYDECESCSDGGFGTIDRIGAGEQLPSRDIAHIRALYDGEISFADQELGRLLDRMREAGYLDNTMIILTADEGQSLNDNDVWFHPNILFNSVIRAPLIIDYPGSIPEGLSVSSVTRGVDIMPTILETLGIPPSRQSEGKSLWPLIKGEENEDERVAFTQGIFDRNISIVSGQWKLIRDNQVDDLQLYDLEADPDETNNLAQANPEVAALLDRQAQDWMDSHSIPYR